MCVRIIPVTNVTSGQLQEKNQTVCQLNVGAEHRKNFLGFLSLAYYILGPCEVKSIYMHFAKRPLIYDVLKALCSTFPKLVLKFLYDNILQGKMYSIFI